MSANQAVYPIATMCRVLGVSPSGYYAWTKRPPSRRATSDGALTESIRAAHAASHGTYGAPRIHAELATAGVCVGRKRIARLMRDAGLAGRQPPQVRRHHAARRWPTGARPGRAQLHGGAAGSAVGGRHHLHPDLGRLPLSGGRARCLQPPHRRLVDGDDLATQLVLDALDMALATRRPKGVIHHSDQGSQYTSIAFGTRCREAGVRPSMGSVGDAYDNAMAESFFATLECELLDRRRFKTQAEARIARVRLHRGLLQSAPAPFLARLSLAGRLRAASRTSKG